VTTGTATGGMTTGTATGVDDRYKRDGDRYNDRTGTVTGTAIVIRALRFCPVGPLGGALCLGKRSVRRHQVPAGGGGTM
jgi:hypothetical protein